ncbi:hypothetical protein DRO61_03895, partial [Candidatus Bathyarchaeota archaeon]
MRDTERIDVLIDYIRKHWRENPDLRLTQLIDNIVWETGAKRQLTRSQVMNSWAYNMEDDLLIEEFKSMYPATGMLD